QPASRFVADFIGDANLVQARLQRSGDSMATVTLGPLALALPHRGADDGEVLVAIRPEGIALFGAPPAEPHMMGTVAKAAYLGDHMEYTVTTPVGDLFLVDRDVASPRPVGGTVYLA